MTVEAGGGDGTGADALGGAEGHGAGGLSSETNDFSRDGAAVAGGEGDTVTDGGVMGEAGEVNGEPGEAADMAVDIESGEGLEACGCGLGAGSEGGMSHNTENT